MLDVKYDEKLGLVRVVGEGFYSLADEQRAATETQNAIARCRSVHGDLKLLVVCASLVQDAAVMQAAVGRTSMLTGPHDRIAFLCDSSLVKMQASRFFTNDSAKCFVSESAAVMWLLADRGIARVDAA